MTKVNCTPGCSSLKLHNLDRSGEFGDFTMSTCSLQSNFDGFQKSGKHTTAWDGPKTRGK